MDSRHINNLGKSIDLVIKVLVLTIPVLIILSLIGVGSIVYWLIS